jgi:uncharacterized membrane protein
MAMLIALLPAGYLAMVYNQLPAIVPTHFGADMEPDRMGEKAELWLVTGILSLVSIGMYFLLNNLHRIDPKRRGAGSSSAFGKLAFGMVVFLAALNFIIIASAKGTVAMQNFLFPLLGLLFAFLGNYMNHIKPNYFAGIRLPWTLSSDENWRRTHEVAGKLWFAGGMLIAVVSLFIPVKAMLPIFIGVMLVITLIPVIYSYLLFKQQP